MNKGYQKKLINFDDIQIKCWLISTSFEDLGIFDTYCNTWLSSKRETKPVWVQQDHTLAYLRIQRRRGSKYYTVCLTAATSKVEVAVFD